MGLFNPNIKKLAKNNKIEKLIKALTHKNYLTRTDAARSLGRIGNKRAVEPLISVLRQDKSSYVRCDAAEALGNIRDARALEPLIEALNNKGYDIRRNAAEALEKLGWKPDINESGAYYWIAKKEKDKYIEMGETAVGPLIVTLEDGNFVQRMDAAVSLGQIGDKRAVKPLIAILEDKDENLRLDGVIALGKIGDKRAVEPLLELLENKEKCKRPGLVVKALGKIGDKRAVEPLIAELKDKSSTIRHITAEALGMIGDTRAVEPLLAILEDENEDIRVRKDVAKALGEIGDDRAAEPLITLLGDKSWDLCNYAGKALDRLNCKPDDKKDLAIYYIINEYWEECVNLGAPAVDPLISILKNNKAKINWQVSEVLAEIGKLSEEALTAILNSDDVDKDVREAVSFSLYEISTHTQNKRTDAYIKMDKDFAKEVCKLIDGLAGEHEKWIKHSAGYSDEILNDDSKSDLEKAIIGVNIDKMLKSNPIYSGLKNIVGVFTNAPKSVLTHNKIIIDQITVGLADITLKHLSKTAHSFNVNKQAIQFDELLSELSKILNRKHYRNEIETAEVRNKLISQVEFYQYTKKYIPDTVGYCSDRECNCNETQISKGSGYLYISQEAVVFMKARKKGRKVDFLFDFLFPLMPVLVCEKSAKKRNIDMKIADEDAKRWWETGKVPLRPTPTI